MPEKINPIDLDQIKTYPLKNRQNKVKLVDFAKICTSTSTVSDLVNSLPNILIGTDFRAVVQAIVAATRSSKPVIFGIGAHVIKCGLSPWIIELMQRGVITAIAMNGASSIHDFEIAMIGETSEDVTSGLIDGTFGMVTETGKLMCQACECGEVQLGQIGMGMALGAKLLEINPPYVNHSILAKAVQLNVPATVHIALGTDIIHMHNNNVGTILGRASFIDFRLFAAVVKMMSDGGIYLNLGSAVILPEIFQKALTIAQNLGANLRNFITVNLDMEQQYRPVQNVVKRPSFLGAKGYTITGHHELIIPLLGCAILQYLDEGGKVS